MFGCSLTEATEKQVYRALCTFVRESLEEQNRAFQKRLSQNGEKKVYYMSMEFLVGTSLRNNLYNLGILDEVKTLLEKQGFSLDRLCGMEPDAGLGNGGLGRLASCYMDAATGLGYSVTGYSIRYEFGIFRQKIVHAAYGVKLLGGVSALAAGCGVKLRQLRYALNIAVVLFGAGYLHRLFYHNMQ